MSGLPSAEGEREEDQASPSELKHQTTGVGRENPVVAEVTAQSKADVLQVGADVLADFVKFSLGSNS
jgi:hypothetical protein